MKAMDILCSSQASTAICLSMDQAFSSSNCSSSNSIQLGSRAIDRHNPIIKDPSRFPFNASSSSSSSSSSSASHSRPYPYHHQHNTKKSSSSKPKDLHDKSSTIKSHDQKNQPNAAKQNANHSPNPVNSILRSWVRVRPPADSVTLAGSSRYLLSDADDYDPVLALHSNDDNKAQVVLQDETNSTASKHTVSSNQVVVLRVSLHCKGCVGKVRKHLSRMDGVSSFSIDLAAQKVTIVGDVTPLNVLASVSKVKNAQFWPAAAAGSGIAETKTRTSLI